MKCVFFTLSVSLLISNQFDIFFISSLVLWINSFGSLPNANIFESSAKRRLNKNEDTFDKSLMYSRNNSGPSIDPCSTPHFTRFVFDLVPSKSTYCSLCEPNSLTVPQTSTLHNTIYFNNTWTKIQLRSDPVNMQPDKTKCYRQRPITTLWPAASKMLSTCCGSLPPNSGTLSLHIERNCRIRRGVAGYWNVTFSHHKAAGMSWCSQANIRWIIEICMNCVVHLPFDGYHELSGD